MRELNLKRTGMTLFFSCLLILCSFNVSASDRERPGNISKVIVVQSDTHLPVSAKPIRNIVLGGGEHQDWSYQELLDKARKEAIDSDANVVKINERIKRSKVNTSDRIVATLYHVEDVKPLETEMPWRIDRKLTWDDFRGPIPFDAEEITAAATFCGIGFETSSITTSSDKLRVKVYNTFYANKSWGRPEEMNDHVLAHEQGHFDLCELYTRMLRKRLHNVSISVQTLKPVLRAIYAEVQKEYKERQADYERETEHGVNLAGQKKWEQIIARELVETQNWSSEEAIQLALR